MLFRRGENFFADPPQQFRWDLIVGVISCVTALVELAALHFTWRTVLPTRPFGAGPSQVSDQMPYKAS